MQNDHNNQNIRREFRPRIKFTYLSEYPYDILRKLYDHQVITLLEIRLEDTINKDSQWYNEEEYYHFHYKKFHDKNKYQTLKNVIQDLIDNGKLEVDNPFAIPNQNLGIYQNPLPQHPSNVISLYSKEN